MSHIVTGLMNTFMYACSKNQHTLLKNLILSFSKKIRTFVVQLTILICKMTMFVRAQVSQRHERKMWIHQPALPSSFGRYNKKRNGLFYKSTNLKYLQPVGLL